MNEKVAPIFASKSPLTRLNTRSAASVVITTEIIRGIYLFFEFESHIPNGIAIKTIPPVIANAKDIVCMSFIQNRLLRFIPKRFNNSAWFSCGYTAIIISNV